MSDGKPTLSTADILTSVRNTDGNDAIAALQQAARERLARTARYGGPRYCGRSIEEWMDRADAGLANLHEIRKAFYRVTPAAAGSVPALIRWLSHPHRHYRHAAARTLGLMGPAAQPAAEALVRLLDDDGNSIRAQALESLLNVGIPRAAIPNIAQCLLVPDTVVQRSALACLRAVGSEAAGAVPQLIAALGNDQLVADAANALAAIGSPAALAVPELVRILATHEFVEYRCAAATALGRIRTREAIAAIREGACDRHRAVRAAVQAALQKEGR